MSWYNYLFAAFGVLGVLGCLGYGMPKQAAIGHVAGVLCSIALAIFWAVIFYWNVYA